MKLSRERKIYLGLGAAALAALGVDRLFLDSSVSGPSDASAIAEIAELGVPGVDDLAVSPPKIPWDELEPDSVTRRLSELSGRVDVTQTQDAFGVLGWLGASGRTDDAPELGAAPVPATGWDRAVQFQQKHRLKAVICAQNGGYALLDEHTVLAIGESIDGYSVQAVGDRSAVFATSNPESDASRVRLTLKSGM